MKTFTPTYYSLYLLALELSWIAHNRSMFSTCTCTRVCVHVLYCSPANSIPIAHSQALPLGVCVGMVITMPNKSCILCLVCVPMAHHVPHSLWCIYMYMFTCVRMYWCTYLYMYTCITVYYAHTSTYLHVDAYIHCTCTCKLLISLSINMYGT